MLGAEKTTPDSGRRQTVHVLFLRLCQTFSAPSLSLSPIACQCVGQAVKHLWISTTSTSTSTSTTISLIYSLISERENDLRLPAPLFDGLPAWHSDEKYIAGMLTQSTAIFLLKEKKRELCRRCQSSHGQLSSAASAAQSVIFLQVW